MSLIIHGNQHESHEGTVGWGESGGVGSVGVEGEGWAGLAPLVVVQQTSRRLTAGSPQGALAENNKTQRMKRKEETLTWFAQRFFEEHSNGSPEKNKIMLRLKTIPNAARGSRCVSAGEFFFFCLFF